MHYKDLNEFTSFYIYWLKMIVWLRNEEAGSRMDIVDWSGLVDLESACGSCLEPCGSGPVGPVVAHRCMSHYTIAYYAGGVTHELYVCMYMYVPQARVMSMYSH